MVRWPRHQREVPELVAARDYPDRVEILLWLAVPIRLLAGAVAYSRVHTGVHYPGDVVIGSIVGAGTAATVAAACDRIYRLQDPNCKVP